MTTRTKNKSLRSIIIFRVAPAAVLLLVVVVAFTEYQISKTIRQEIQGRVDASAVHVANAADIELDAILSACQAVADNDMVVNGIVDLEHRQSTLLSYFRSLRLPGPNQQRVTMTDYKGRVIASTLSNSPGYGTSTWFNQVMAGEQFIGTQGSELIVAAPVEYSNRAEGVIVAVFEIDEFFRGHFPTPNSEAVVFHTEGSVVFSTKPKMLPLSEEFLPPPDWLLSTAQLSVLPQLKVSYLKSEQAAMSAAFAVNLSQLIQLLVFLLALVASIWLAAYLASEPLHQILEQVGEIESTGDLRLRVDQDGPKEFQKLSEGFNNMLKKLERSTVSLEQYRVSEERLALAIQGTNDGLWDWDLKTNKVWYAPRYKEMLGYQDHEFPNELESFQAHLHPDDEEDTWDAVKKHMEEAVEYDIEHRLQKKSGEYCWFRARGAVVKDEHGNSIRMSGSMQDISERKQYQLTLERSNRDLEQFAFIASHDLQEPLRKVTSFCELLQQENWDQLNREGKLYVEYVVDAAKRMRSLVQDLLTFSKIGSDGIKRRTIDAEAALEVALSNLETAIDESEATITFDRLPRLFAHEREISQLFQNLIGNAIKYRSERKPVVHVSVASKIDEWIFSITDNGIGIAPEYREQVFGIFKRLHSRKEFSGTGIGLAICKRIIEQLDGKIWFETSSEPGCKVCFTIPKRNTKFTSIQPVGANHEFNPVANPSSTG